MKTTFLLLLMLLPCFAQAGQSDCGFIRDLDQQAYCRAVNGSGNSQCGFIRNADLQAMCRAHTGGGQSQCGLIRDRDMQAQCRAGAR